jgi:hypothetical protein
LTGQSEFARRKRLKSGCCPVHGIGMSQVAGYGFTKAGTFDARSPFTIVACPRHDCAVFATQTGPDDEAFPVDPMSVPCGDIQLLMEPPEWQMLRSRAATKTQTVRRPSEDRGSHAPAV